MASDAGGKAVGAGDYTAALASLDGFLALQAEHDLEIPERPGSSTARCPRKLGFTPGRWSR